MSMNELTAKIRELRELQALIDEAQQEAEAIKDAIKAHKNKWAHFCFIHKVFR